MTNDDDPIPWPHGRTRRRYGPVSPEEMEAFLEEFRQRFGIQPKSDRDGTEPPPEPLTDEALEPKP